MVRTFNRNDVAYLFKGLPFIDWEKLLTHTEPEAMKERPRMAEELERVAIAEKIEPALLFCGCRVLQRELCEREFLNLALTLKTHLKAGWNYGKKFKAPDKNDFYHKDSTIRPENIETWAIYETFLTVANVMRLVCVYCEMEWKWEQMEDKP